MLNSLPNFHFYHGDITKPEDVMDALHRYNIDTILHFAAQSHVDLSFGNSYAFTYANVFGTHVLLECARTAGVKLFLHVSTDEVYGDTNEDEPDLLESAILAPTNPYAASKAAAEMIVNAYYKSFKLPIIMVRSNNVYGPHQYPEKIIPKFITLLERNQRMLLHGDGSPTRRYLYASDAVDAFDIILHCGEPGQIYNVGSETEITNLDLCKALMKVYGLDGDDPSVLAQHVEYAPDRPYNDHRYAVDGTKLRSLGWTQRVPFAQGIKETVEWYKAYGNEWWGDLSPTLSAFPEIECTDDGLPRLVAAEVVSKHIVT